MKNIVRVLCFRIKLFGCQLFGKDSMRIKVDYYRSKGATIGNNTRIFSEISGLEPYLITIGNNVTVAANVNFCTHDNSAIKFFPDATDFVGPIIIGDNCFIGTGSILMGGITIGNNCIVGAGSVVTKSFIESGKIIAGNPAKVVGTVEEYKEKNQRYSFNFKGMNFEQRKKEIISNQARWKRK